MVQSRTFLRQLRGLPPKDIPRVLARIERLLISPIDPQSVRVQKFKTDIYRVRSGDYRILYTIGPGYVHLLGVDSRDHVYDTNEPIVPLLDIEAAGLTDQVDALIAGTEGTDNAARDVQRPGVSQSFSGEGAAALDATATPSIVLIQPTSLPRELDAEFLRQLGISPMHIPCLAACKTLDDLIAAPVPEDVREHVYDAAVTPDYDQVAQDPMYIVDSIDDLRRYADGDLIDFLLKLDQEQERHVTWAINGSGPNLLKGRPGTGKSIVAVYRTRAMIQALRKLGIAQPRVLFTSYTNSLVNSSRQLLTRLLRADAELVTTCTADALVSDILKQNGTPHSAADDAIVRAFIYKAREQMVHGTPEDQTLAQMIAHLSPDYLMDEIDHVIVGREHTSLDSYLGDSRAGRKVRLAKMQRQAVWRLAAIRQTLMAHKHHRSFAENRRTAVELVRAGHGPAPFDAVIVDEAQDLDPTVLRLLVALCRTPDRLFLTADANQSIFGNGFSWSNVHADLRFRGRTGVLRRNYRSTRQIDEATTSYLAGAELDATEPTAVECVRAGVAPVLRKLTSGDEEIAGLCQVIRLATRAVRVGLGSCAVLTPTKRSGEAIAKSLTARGLPAEFMASHNVDLERPLVKVLTFHAAKGLEFPIVAIAGLDAKSTFLKTLVGVDDEIAESLELRRRTIYVAMTRAMRELHVFVPETHPSPLLSGFDPRYWVITKTASDANAMNQKGIPARSVA